VLGHALAVAAHQQEIAVAQPPFLFDGGLGPQAQQKPALRPQAQRGDHRLRAQFRLVVGMPAHVLGAAAVAVQQDAVERRGAGGFERRQQGVDGRMPGFGNEALARIAIGRASVAHPAAQPRRIDPAPEHPDAMHRPRHLAGQPCLQGHGLRRRQPAGAMQDASSPEACGAHRAIIAGASVNAVPARIAGRP